MREIIAVLKRLFTGWPLGIVVASVAIGALLASPVVAVVGLVVAGVVAWKGTSGRKGQLRRVAAVDGEVNDGLMRDLEALQVEVASLSGKPGIEHIALNLQEQFATLQAQYLSFREALAKKFSQAELTFGRYAKASDQVLLSTMDELQRAVNLLKSVASVDLDQLRAQERVSARRKEPTTAESAELSTLRERLALYDQQIEQARSILAGNETSLTKLAAATSELVELKTSRGRSELESTVAVKELEHLASRLPSYGIDNLQRETLASNANPPEPTR
jgi:hypothetical protein